MVAHDAGMHATEVEIDAIATDLRATVDNAIAPTRFGLWLRIGHTAK
jgi:hypothetical protein